MGTTKQSIANKHNALKSTGAKTIAGKEISSRNALKHGILSQRLFLDEENPEDFAELFNQLQQDLRPDGYLEKNLVEKIAIIIWRQQRLIAAESATVALSCKKSDILPEVNRTLNISHSADKTFSEYDLDIPDKNRQDEYGKALDEMIEFRRKRWSDPITITTIKAQLPMTWKVIEQWAIDEDMSAEEYLEGDLEEEMVSIYFYLVNDANKQNMRSEVLAIYELVKRRRSILQNVPLLSFDRYQISLDNQLYKAMKALWQQQEHRQENPIDVTPLDEDAA